MGIKVSELLAQAKGNQNAQAMSHSEFTPLDLPPLADTAKGVVGTAAGSIADLMQSAGVFFSGNLANSPEGLIAQQYGITPSQLKESSDKAGQNLPLGSVWWGENVLKAEDPEGLAYQIAGFFSPDATDLSKLPLLVGSMGGMHGLKTLLGRGGRYKDRSRVLYRNYEDALAAFEENSSVRNQIKIYQDTGWFQDVDKNWKIHFTDRNIKVNKNKLRADYDAGAMPRVGDTIQHDELFDMYPELEEYRIDFEIDPDLDKTQGTFDPEEKVILLSIPNFEDDYTPTLIHELNHGIQYYEGWHFGADPNYAAPFSGNVSDSKVLQNFENTKRMAANQVDGIVLKNNTLLSLRSAPENILQGSDADLAKYLKNNGIDDPTFARSIAINVLLARADEVDAVYALNRIGFENDLVLAQQHFYDEVSKQLTKLPTEKEKVRALEDIWYMEYFRSIGEVNARYAASRYVDDPQFADMFDTTISELYSNIHPIFGDGDVVGTMLTRGNMLGLEGWGMTEKHIRTAEPRTYPTGHASSFAAQRQERLTRATLKP